MYGAVIAVSIFISAIMAEQIVKKEGRDANVLWGTLFWGLVFGIIGARLYHVADFWETYSQNPAMIAQTWRGGLGIFGGLFGGLFAAFAYLKIKKQDVAQWLDIAGLALPLAQGIGRLGNIFNGELLPYAQSESIADFVLFAILVYVWKHKRRLKDGSVFLAYIFGYASIRLMLENTRVGAWEVSGVNVAEAISLILAVAAFSIFAIRQPFAGGGSRRRGLWLSVFGIFLSLYLTYIKLSKGAISCGFGECDLVQQSRYSEIFGVPVAVFGTVFYLALFALLYKYEGLARYAKYWLYWGIAFSIYLLFVEVFVIKAICGWCMISFVNIAFIYALHCVGPRGVQTQKQD